MTTGTREPGNERRQPATELADADLDRGLITDSHTPITLLGAELLTVRCRRVTRAASPPQRPAAPERAGQRARTRSGTRAVPGRSGQRRRNDHSGSATARFTGKPAGSEAGIDSGQLRRLGMRLIQLSAEAADGPGEAALPLRDAAVLEEILQNPGISIRQIRDRTGFSRSHLAASVARLRDRGLITPAGRRPAGGSAWRPDTRVQARDNAVQAISRRQSRPVDSAVLRAAGDPSQAERVIELIGELAGVLP